MLHRLTLVLACIAPTVAATPRPAAGAPAVRFHIQELGDGAARGVNEAGQVVGESRAGHAFYFDGTRRIDVSLPGEQQSFLSSINESGIAVGGSFDAGGKLSPLRFDGTTAGVIPFSGTGNTNAPGINDAGDILLDTDIFLGGDVVGARHPVLRTAGGQEMTIPLLPGAASMVGTAINNAGVIVGSTADEHDSAGPAFRFQSGQTSPLVTVAGDVTNASPADLNDAGDAVGAGVSSGGEAVGVLIIDGQVIDLSERVGQPVSDANGINSQGQIAATLQLTDNAGTHAILIDGNTLIDLNDVIDQTGWRLTDANDINDRGQIVGTGFLNGEDRAFLLTPIAGPVPIPLPAAVVPGLALLAGLLGVRGATRRTLV
jgi:uncharacterized membrane protein